MYLPKPDTDTFLPCPEGHHLGVCYRFIDLGTQQYQHPGQVRYQRKVLLSWELPEVTLPEGEHAGEPYTFHQQYTWSMHEKATLRKHLESWRGVPFREGDFGEGGCDTRDLVGKACQLTLVRIRKGGRHLAKLQTITRASKHATVPAQPFNRMAYLSLETKRFDFLTFYRLSARLQDIIRQSPEFQKLASLPVKPGSRRTGKDQSHSVLRLGLRDLQAFIASENYGQ